ncbi:MAG TPA: F0F1 ATP synthase subunit epsilon [Methylocystis sp.]|nr:F0F1 ATP synthase subunit epsilon [Methylocystis sp.]
MAAFHFELVSPEKLLFSGDVDSVVAPGADGQFTVLANHAPVMTTLKPGVVVINGAEKLFVRGGFADVCAKGFTILAEQAIAIKDVDITKLEQDIKDAREDVADAKIEADRVAAAEKLQQLLDLRAAL